VICDFHGAVVVDGGRAGDDADDGGGDFLPSVEFFGAAVRGTKAEEPGPEGVDVEGFAVEFGADGGFTLTVGVVSIAYTVKGYKSRRVPGRVPWGVCSDVLA